ncbi:MAG: 2Fe-2S iron-sulfur cluster binding domain-containing protein [Bdellovibrionales bacterium]|nr:2Fe-2S iron-sulfur cluster binding domain-containing protein [Bdellovibrionales bacterium]
MPIINTNNKFPPLNVDNQSNLFESLYNNHIPIASSCKGDGICKRCEVSILSGQENINPKTSFESHCKENRRLACQCWLAGDVDVSTTYW